jgi:hypothetical protein
MKKRLTYLGAVGIVLIFGVFLFWDNQANHKFTSVFSVEPTYEGQNLTYWMQHWYQQYGQRNLAAEEAVRTMGTNAVPYLVKWITQPAHNQADQDQVSRALKGFEILGSVASPAIPDLVKAIGRNGNFPAVALGYIGTNAIPALTNRLLESASNAKQSGILSSLFFSSRQPRESFYVPRNIFCALSFYGTNAQPAVPALIAYIQNPNAREAGDAAGVLAMAGHNQPKIVFPVLFNCFSNSPGMVRFDVADALSTFGTNAVSAIPLLLFGLQDPDAQVRAHIAVAIKKIAPNTPHALDPVIQNLENGEACQQTIYILGTLGTNGMEALPGLLKCLRSGSAADRPHAERCILKLDGFTDEKIEALGENLSHPNELTYGETYATLGKFASRSQLAFAILLKQGLLGNHTEDWRVQARFPLMNISRADLTFLLQCLDDPDAQVRSGALLVFHDLERSVPQAIPKLRELAEKDPDPDVRSRAADMLKLQSQ